MKPINLTGLRFGKLIAVKLVREGRYLKWGCQCDCGNFINVVTQRLREGKTKSCGCLRRSIAIARFTKHNRSRTSEYRIWNSMKGRCFNSKNHAFEDYGARGITVCDEWLNFETFLKDMGPRPSPRHSIERINNDLGYCRSNCCWATKTTQANNRRTNHRILYHGRTKTLSQWADELGVNRCTVMSRLSQGWSEQDAISKGLVNHGSKHYMARLSDLDVLKIRQKHADGAKQKHLASEFGIGKVTVWHIVHRKTWKHI